MVSAGMLPWSGWQQWEQDGRRSGNLHATWWAAGKLSRSITAPARAPVRPVRSVSAGPARPHDLLDRALSLRPTQQHTSISVHRSRSRRQPQCTYRRQSDAGVSARSVHRSTGAVRLERARARAGRRPGVAARRRWRAHAAAGRDGLVASAGAQCHLPGLPPRILAWSTRSRQERRRGLITGGRAGGRRQG